MEKERNVGNVGKTSVREVDGRCFCRHPPTEVQGEVIGSTPEIGQTMLQYRNKFKMKNWNEMGKQTKIPTLH
jgi:hypothetical protein